VCHAGWYARTTQADFEKQLGRLDKDVDALRSELAYKSSALDDSRKETVLATEAANRLQLQVEAAAKDLAQALSDKSSQQESHAAKTIESSLRSELSAKSEELARCIVALEAQRKELSEVPCSC
jgi:hypothetical protein